MYIDPNPITSLNNEGHNYFLSQNPYVLNSYAGFGEAYYNVTPDLKLTGGMRWTDDQKHFIDIPSELLVAGYGYPVTGIVDQKWNKLTGRFAANWTPKLDFTDQTLVYGSYAHGYKAGGANPPGAALLTFGDTGHHQSHSSADLQAGIHRCLRTRHQEHAAGWRADAERRCLLLQLRAIRFRASWTAPRSTTISMPR